MNRQVLSAALGRAECCAAATTRAPTTTLSNSWGATIRPFSTSMPGYFQDSKNYNEGDKPPSSRQERSDAAAQKLANLASRPRQTTLATRPGGGGGGGGGLSDSVGPKIVKPPTVSGPFGSPQTLGGPKILSLRSLRGTFRGGLRGGLRGGPAGPGAQRLNQLGRRPPLGAAGRGLGGLRGRGGGGGGGGARGASGGRGGRGGRAGRGGRREKKKKMDFAEGEGKLTWNLEEQAVFDRIEQGEIVPFLPKLAPDNLSGYGPGIATDAPIGKVETVLRAMRMISGGQSFNSDSGVTVDAKAMRRRYHHEKKPIFFNSVAEKEWAERAEPNWKVRAPSEATRKAILDLAVLGLYPESKPVTDLKDISSVIANYHNRTWLYRTEDSKKFMDKVLGTLPEDLKPKSAPAKKTA